MEKHQILDKRYICLFKATILTYSIDQLVSNNVGS